MIVKVVAKESVVPGEYYHEFLVEADRVEIQFHKRYEDSGEADWYFTDQVVDHGVAALLVRAWHAWPHDKFEVGVVRSGRVFVVNDSGKTVDKYVI